MSQSPMLQITTVFLGNFVLPTIPNSALSILPIHSHMVELVLKGDMNMAVSLHKIQAAEC